MVKTHQGGELDNVPAATLPASILVIDDSRENLRLLNGVLAHHGYTVRVATNGRSALASVQVEPPDLILLDVMMPEMDGYEVCARLKADPDARTRDIPVIFVSVEGDVPSKVKAFSVGGIDYITKPFQIDEVLARVETHLALRNLHVRLEAQNIQLRQEIVERMRAERALQKADEALRQYADELQARNVELDAFAHTVAHDLKGIVAPSLGLVDFLRINYATLPDDQVASIVWRIFRNVRKMADVVDGLLLQAQVRKQEVQKDPLDMASIVAEAQQSVAHLVEEHKAEIVLPETWPEALGYAPWVEAVWVNYLSNAIKYGGRPPIVALGAETQPGDVVRFWVRDNGRGLEKKDRDKLFVPFERLARIGTGGHGLGLSIVRRIVEKLDGQVGVESEVGQGSVFTFTLPAVTRSSD